MSNLQNNRSYDKWTCDICGKLIEGTRNTLHLGVISHIKAEERRGLREIGFLRRYNKNEK